MRRYFALWIPVKEKTKLSVINPPVGKVISDSREYGGYFIKGEIDKESYNFTLKYKPKSTLTCLKSFSSIQFICEDLNEYGFIVYSVDLESVKSDDCFVEFVKDNLNPALYHYIKGCFHQHEYHHPSEDSLIRSFSSEKEISLDSDLCRILQVYTKQYVGKFNDFLESSQYEFNKAKQCLNHTFDIRSSIKTLRRIIDSGNTIKGEKQYFDFLLKVGSENSCSNELACNVSNVWNKIELFIDNVNSAYSISTTSVGLKLSLFGVLFGVIGLIIGVISLIHTPSVDYTSVNNQIDSTTVTLTNFIEFRVKCAQNSIIDSINVMKEKFDRCYQQKQKAK